MAKHSALVWQWIDKAEEDWQAACLLRGYENQAATTCFHCQQCAEKLLKAALLAAGVGIPKIHELVVLSELLTEADPSWHWDAKVLDALTTGAVASRYPGYEMTRADADQAIAATAELRHALLQQRGLADGGEIPAI
jgi:HEPN domain-containing protein